MQLAVQRVVELAGVSPTMSNLNCTSSWGKFGQSLCQLVHRQGWHLQPYFIIADFSEALGELLQFYRVTASVRADPTFASAMSTLSETQKVMPEPIVSMVSMVCVVMRCIFFDRSMYTMTTSAVGWSPLMSSLAVPDLAHWSISNQKHALASASFSKYHTMPLSTQKRKIIRKTNDSALTRLWT